MYRHRLGYFFLLIALLLSACKPCCPPFPSDEEKVCVYCGDRSVKKPNDRQALLDTEEKLEDENITIVHLGEYITLVIPADPMFYPRSPRIMRRSEYILKLVDEYIRNFNVVRINVDVYTDNVGNPLRNDALSQARAENVIDFMWRDDIDTRLLLAKGLGQRLPIASNTRKNGREMNRRIEISFRIYNADQIYDP